MKIIFLLFSLFVSFVAQAGEKVWTCAGDGFAKSPEAQIIVDGKKIQTYYSKLENRCGKSIPIGTVVPETVSVTQEKKLVDKDVCFHGYVFDIYKENGRAIPYLVKGKTGGPVKCDSSASQVSLDR